MSSNKQFDRWNPKGEHSLPYAVYKSYGSELRRMYRTMSSSHKYVYTSLNIDKNAKWSDSPNYYFRFDAEIKKNNAYFTTLKDWSNAYNDLENWTNLNALVTINANFETYLVKIIQLSLESDFGLLYGVSQEFDGIKAVKKGNQFDFSREIINCTKGDWHSRIKYMKKYFNEIPKILEDNIDKLENIRKIRNDVAHAFGRDIEKSHEIRNVQKHSIKKLNSIKLCNYWELIDECVRELDKQLYRKHIGEYQLLLLYHIQINEIENKINPKMRNVKNKAREFRKKFGRDDITGNYSLGQEFCEGLVLYYESLNDE